MPRAKSDDPRQRIEVSCPGCDADDGAPLAEERGFLIRRCRACGLVYVNPRLASEELKRIYSDYYHCARHWEAYRQSFPTGPDAAGSKAVGAKLEDWDRRYDVIWRTLRGFLPPTENRWKALDIGAGTSRWSSWLRPKGVETWSFDIAPNSRANAAVQQKDPEPRWVLAPSLEEAELPPRTFDLVTLWDVIEHVETPREMMRTVRTLLRPGGIVFLQTPNAAWNLFTHRVCRRLPRRWVAPLLSEYGIFLPEQHLQTYGLPQLLRLVRETGFVAERSPLANWSEAGGSQLAAIAYALIYAQARLVHTVTGGKCCSNIGLSLVARRPE